MSNFKQGDDTQLKVLVIKDGVALNLAGADSVRVKLAIKSVIVDKFASKVLLGTPPTLQTPVGYKPLTVDTTVTNQVNIVLDNTVTKVYPVGVIKAYIEVIFADVTYADGLRTEQYEAVVGAVEKGESPY